MRNAALVLGIIGGIIGMIVGFFSYGYVEFIAWFGEIEDIAAQVDNPALIKAVSFLAPLLAIAGGAMARSQALVLVAFAASARARQALCSIQASKQASKQ